VRHLAVIGIGAGDPDQITLQAVAALNRLDVLFVVDKPGEAAELSRFRDEIRRRHLARGGVEVVRIRDAARDRAASAYGDAVKFWRAERARAWERAIGAELGDGDRGGFLVWGDPALYDGTISVLERVRAGGRLRFELEVIPGVSSVHALAARHGIALNRIGGAVQITTGRRLRAGMPTDADDVVVMLDPSCTFAELAHDDLDIYWGAYLGTPDELLVAGPVAEVADEIRRLRREARTRKGWVMDTYLLRRRHGRRSVDA
jgi:precorrin-6A synthase